MIRPSILVFCALAQSATATAQTPLPIAAERSLGALKHAGTYHVATGTWTRSGATIASFGPDVIYNNTASSGYFTTFGGQGGAASGSTNFDEGGLPGTTNQSTTWGGAWPEP